ncbi:substrate-binding domain-containing protein [Paenibacillus apiarius]|uniref:Substrate-binding domain-containing protein n=1 Tax=Paenibacillus apiarius TaxID=46240 RepID=A0ABT4DNT8_9BACL|nr:substrate-binding domain-containing protein [Paenibacillus apiarius]MCY9512831.1 substrate-binding domain-containing protein [Paenibacillus apiarius]MCY9519025.1 substrate-binding domain-containing protein [Paenibacillus apiarius]MCY9550834.1 substrate-binding domain-containing protein [Paenibacillus apiarius]MCY9559732.1 substrate-binding domain-containing protein [Paenibacillus apiarius]MCY9681975.1 substrate-binding domain-containing protein [Paenibacillus apiarius]
MLIHCPYARPDRGLKAKVKRAILLLLISMSLSLLTACSGSGIIEISEPEQRNFALVVKTMNDDYWNTVRMGAEAAAKEFNVKITFLAPEHEKDVQQQVEYTDQALKLGVDAIILAASDYMALGQVVDQASYYHIPVISIDSEVGSTKVQSYIGTNSYQMGRTAGQELVKLMNGKGKVGVMSFVQGARNAEQREEGLMDLFSRYDGIEVAETAYCYSDSELAYELTLRMLAKHPDLQGIVSLNSISSLGVARAVKDADAGRAIRVVTIDSTPELMGYLQDEVIGAAVVQNPFTMGYLGVKYAAEALQGSDIPERVETEAKVIDLHNMFWPENQKLLFPFVK